MTLLTTSELAAALGVTPGRISQYVSEGKLSGCFIGEARRRRFDLDKCASALGRKLDGARSLAVGSSARRVADDLQAASLPLDRAATPASREDPIAPAPGGDDLRRYEVARAQLAEEKARAARRDNAVEDGIYVLASAVERASSRLLQAELAQFETVLREASRSIADVFGIDYRSVHKVARDTWRTHRGERTSALLAAADAVELSEVEREADI